MSQPSPRVVQHPRALRRWALVAALASLTGCGAEGERAGGPARGARSGSTVPEGTVVVPDLPPPGPPDSARRALGIPQPWGPEPDVVQEDVPIDAPPEPPVARDLGRELAVALGAPSDCIPDELVEALPRELRVTVRAALTVTGLVTRAETSGNVPEPIRACIADRVRTVSLPGPIEGAPREVSTELVLTLLRTDPAPTPALAAPPVVPAPLPAGAQPPGIVLPAQGAVGRPEGAVAPSVLLPAIGADGRPAGFVPPSSTLPALAPPVDPQRY